MTQLFTKKASLWFRGLAIILVVLSHYAEWWAWFTPTEGNAELFRNACSRLGPYGVAIFFLFSGYGLVYSIGSKPMNLRFIIRRILATYLPYLIIVGMIEALSGGFSDLKDFGEYLNGHDYWYMVVLFWFYIGFICIWTIHLRRRSKDPAAQLSTPADHPANRHIHAVLFVLFTWALSYRLYAAGEHSFWYISNPAFVLGILLALYEPFFKKLLDASRSPMLVLTTAGMAVSVYYALFSAAPNQWTPEKTVRYEYLAVFIWTVLIIYLASDLQRFDPVLPLLGKWSLYLYLTHQFIFMRVINEMTGSFDTRFIVAAILTIVISLALGKLIGLLTAPLEKQLKKQRN